MKKEKNLPTKKTNNLVNFVANRTRELDNKVWNIKILLLYYTIYSNIEY